MYFKEYETPRATFTVTDIYKGGHKVYLIHIKLSDTLYIPAFGGVPFGTIEAAEKAIKGF